MSSLDARTAATLFDPARLTVARRLQKLKRAQLAERVGVSAAAISQYETGVAKPRAATLAELSLQLGMPVGFFASSGRALPSLDAHQGFFRSLRRSSQLDRDAALAQAAVVNEVVKSIEERVELPELDLPDDLSLDPALDARQAEAVAGEIRKRWGLDDEPIPNVVRLLERHGVIVARLALAEDVDAFSWPVPERPIVILGTDKRMRDRSRFDAAHELGHLLMHYSDPEPGSQPLERQAHRFAAALLLPDEPFTKDFTAVGVNWTALMGVKRKWQVSLAAILLRARDLELLTPSAYEAAVRQMSRRGWRQREPGELGPPERPALLRKAAELMSENGIELDEIASQAQIPLVLLKDLVDLVSEERPLVTV